MTRRTALILLGISLVFNVSFVIGVLMANARADAPPDPDMLAGVIADELEMDADQRKSNLELSRRIDRERRARHDMRHEWYRKVWTELARDEPDQKLLDEFVAAAPASRRLFLEHARALRDILRPEQRRRLAEVMERLHKRRPKR